MAGEWVLSLRLGGWERLRGLALRGFQRLPSKLGNGIWGPITSHSGLPDTSLPLLRVGVLPYANHWSLLSL